MAAEDGAVDPFAEVVLPEITAAEAVAGAHEHHQGPVAEEQRAGDEDLRARFEVHVKDGGECVADRDGLEGVAEPLELGEVVFEEVALADHAEEPERGDAAEDAPVHLGLCAPLRFIFREGERDGGAGAEEEQGHDPVVQGEGGAAEGVVVPLGLEPVEAGDEVAEFDHPGGEDGEEEHVESAEDVEGFEAVGHGGRWLGVGLELGLRFGGAGF